PCVEFGTQERATTVLSGPARGPVRGPAPEPPARGPAPEPPARGPAREDTGVRVRAAVRRATRRVWIGAAALTTGAVLVVGGLYATDRRERAAWEAERAALHLRVDSLIESGQQAEAALQQEV